MGLASEALSRAVRKFNSTDRCFHMKTAGSDLRYRGRKDRASGRKVAGSEGLLSNDCAMEERC